MADGDLALGPDGDLLFVNGDLQGLTGIDAVVSDVQSRLFFFLGENPLNVDGDGVPYIQTAPIILGKKSPNTQLIASILTETILGAPDVITVDEMDVEFDDATRNLSGGWRATTSFGQTPYVPFGLPIPSA